MDEIAVTPGSACQTNLLGEITEERTRDSRSRLQMADWISATPGWDEKSEYFGFCNFAWADDWRLAIG